MASVQVSNSVTLIGNLGQDPELLTTDAGLKICSFNLATNENWRDKDGQRQTRTDWHTVKAFGKQAETLAQYLRKGSKVAVSGSLRYGRWIDKHDQVRTSAEVVVNGFTFLSPAPQPGAAEAATAAPVEVSAG